MTLSLIFACLWVLLAAIMAMIPSNDQHWRRAYVLIGLGLPLILWVFWENGAVIGLLTLAAMMSVLRWPVRYLLRWLSRGRLQL